jgi:hypothetical protein
MVAPAYALIESKRAKHAAQIIEVDVRVRLALQNPKPEFLVLTRRL